MTLVAVLSMVAMHAQVGTVIRDTIIGVPCRVYLPVGAEHGADHLWPVLYLHHGMYGTEDDWTEKGRLLELLDSLLQEKAIDERIIIMPDNCPGRPTSEEERANATSGEWENRFALFMEEVENRYPVSRDPSRRAIAGLSMGGYHTMRVAYVLDGQFAHIGMFSPATFVHQAATSPELLWIAIGTEDFLYDSLKAYRQWLDEHGVQYTYYETGGGHTWPNWQDYLCRFLKACKK